MNLESALIYQILELQDFDTWANVRKRYLSNEYHQLFEVIEKHTETFHKLPTIEELKLEIRDGATLDKVYALEGVETSAEPYFLLEAVKSSFAQKEILSRLDKWVDSSIAFESAEEAVRHIQQIGVEMEAEVELTPPEESMQKISLFESEEEMANRITLGFNKDFDNRFQFNPTDYIMVGGLRGAGKSITGSNIANNMVENKKRKALYFSIEMQPREILQRACSIATRVPYYKLKNRDLSIDEWARVAKWWSSRYNEGEVAYQSYLEHRNFNEFHKLIQRHSMAPAFVDVIYDANLTLGRIVAEVSKRIALGEDIGLTVVDYVQKVKRTSGGSSHSIQHMDWQEQISVSNGLKVLAQDTGIPVFSPFQIDKEGEARFGRGILDSCDAAFNLKAHKGSNPCMSFETVKMRGADDTETFTSEMDWSTLYIGPNSVEPPEAEKKTFSGKPKQDIAVQTKGVYDV